MGNIACPVDDQVEVIWCEVFAQRTATAILGKGRPKFGSRTIIFEKQSCGQIGIVVAWATERHWGKPHGS